MKDKILVQLSWWGVAASRSKEPQGPSQSRMRLFASRSAMSFFIILFSWKSYTGWRQQTSDELPVSMQNSKSSIGRETPRSQKESELSLMILIILLRIPISTSSPMSKFWKVLVHQQRCPIKSSLNVIEVWIVKNDSYFYQRIWKRINPRLHRRRLLVCRS